MRYTLWSRDRLLGETDLDYVRCMPKTRMGELVATALGETLLAGEPDCDALELELRDASGHRVAAEHVSVQDCDRLARLGERAFAEDEARMQEMDPELQAMVDHDAALLQEWMDAGEPPGFWDDYDTAGERAWKEGVPRFQIFVMLLNEDDIP